MMWGGLSVRAEFADPHRRKWESRAGWQPVPPNLLRCGRGNQNATGQIVGDANGIGASLDAHREASGWVLLFDRQRDAGHQSEPLQFPEGNRITVGNAADDRRRVKRPFDQRHFGTVRTGFIFLGDDVAMRIDFRIAQDGRYAIFEALGDEVLQAFGFFVDFVPRILQNVVQE